MPLSPVSSTSTSIHLIKNEKPNISDAKKNIVDRIKLVYGFTDDICKFNKNNIGSLSLDDLNRISGIYCEGLCASPRKFIHDLSSKSFSISDNELKTYITQTKIEGNDLKKIAEEWIDFISHHSDELSISGSLNRRSQKSQTAFFDFIKKNNKLLEGNPSMSELLAQKIESDPLINVVMESIYHAFLESDEKGFDALDSLSRKPNLGSEIFKSSIISSIIRKLSKLGLKFISSSEEPKLDLVFIKPKSVTDLLINVTNQDKWRGTDNFSGLGNIFEPITFSELRYVKKHNIPVSYAEAQD